MHSVSLFRWSIGSNGVDVGIPVSLVHVLDVDVDVGARVGVGTREDVGVVVGDGPVADVG